MTGLKRNYFLVKISRPLMAIPAELGFWLLNFIDVKFTTTSSITR